ncbi:unnamed protein product [Rotaria magnacalcarata]|uniref:Choline transporter-like protein n=1 Tax=Rotaria magnacalcarata TaxID=392030 RepID=A0A816QPW7_9BILA|nr:unnamed protein product [Rotaria magnacalcarata]CAF4257334.1 unnamed protein product [Rotaria magnacalcarata]
MLSDSVAISVPLRSDDETETNINSDPPAYENPQLDFNGEWKDRGFAIAFWIHTIAVILVGLTLGIPNLLWSMEESSSDILGFKCVIYSLIGAAVASGLVSFLTLFSLQLCAGQLIKCSFLILIIMQILLTVALYFILPLSCFVPGAFILFTLIYISCVRNHIAFAEAHLEVGCASLRSQSSLIFVALFMLIVEFLWLTLWCLMCVGVTHVARINLPSNSISDHGIMLGFLIGKIVLFLLILSCYWGAVTFGNIIHFIAACTVGDWWFTSDGSGHYGMSNSIKRAFTTNLGTICFGSLFEAVIKSLRFFTGNGRRKNCLTCIIDYMLQILEKSIGYLNEWAFTFAALTGQGYIQASRSFIELFKKRGWTAIVNDSIVGITLMIINLGIGLISAVVGGTIMHYMITESSEITGFVIFIACISFLIGILMSSIITTLLKSCVRAVFVCFALNPAALGATHPEHLQKLTKVWHKFYPQEFVSSGYANEFKEPIV